MDKKNVNVTNLRKDFKEITPDGKEEIVEGTEPLNKDPKKKKLGERWEAVKKALDNSKAIIDLSDESDDEDEQQPEMNQEVPPDDQQQQDDGEEGANSDENQNDPDQRPEWLPDEVDHGGEEEGHPQGEALNGEEQPQEVEEQSEGDPEAEQEIEEALRQMGHSDAEIQHIIHGHMVPQVDEAKRAKATHEYIKADHDKEEHEKEMGIRDEEAEHEKALRQKEREVLDEEARAEADHAKRMKDVEYQCAQKEAGETDIDLEHKKRLSDLEYEKAKQESSFNEAKVEAEHKKRMLDLEYENAKKQKELELEFKKKEFDLKLKHSEQLAQEKHKAAMDMAKDDAQARKQEKKMDLQQRAVDKKEDLKISAKQKDDDRKLKAKETAQDRAKTKVKKSEDEDDSLQKSMIGWKFNPKTGQMNHSTLGSIHVSKPPTGGNISVRHNGAHVGDFASHAEAKSGIVNYIGSLGPMNTANMGKAEEPKPAIPEIKPDPKVKEAPLSDYAKNVTLKPVPKKHRNYVDIPDVEEETEKAEEASRGEEWRTQQDQKEPHKGEPADEDSKGEKSNLAADEKRDKNMQLGVSSVNSHNKSKVRTGDA